MVLGLGVQDGVLLGKEGGREGEREGGREWEGVSFAWIMVPGPEASSLSPLPPSLPPPSLPCPSPPAGCLDW